jgi:hypothetical protein
MFGQAVSKYMIVLVLATFLWHLAPVEKGAN